MRLNRAGIIFRTIKDFSPLKFFGWTGSIVFIGIGLEVFVIDHYITVGTFTPYKAFAFAGAFLNATGAMIVFIGILADLIDKIRLTQENCFIMKKRRTKENDSHFRFVFCVFFGASLEVSEGAEGDSEGKKVRPYRAIPLIRWILLPAVRKRSWLQIGSFSRICGGSIGVLVTPTESETSIPLFARTTIGSNFNNFL